MCTKFGAVYINLNNVRIYRSTTDEYGLSSLARQPYAVMQSKSTYINQIETFVGAKMYCRSFD